MPYLRATQEGTEISIHVQPGASRGEIVGLHGDALKIRIEARAVEGAANEALLIFMAHALGVPRREVKIQRGAKSRRKTLVTSLPVERVMDILAQLTMQVTVGEHS